MNYYNLAIEIITWIMAVWLAIMSLGLSFVVWMMIFGWWFGWTKENPEITIYQIWVLFKRRKQLK